MLFFVSADVHPTAAGGPGPADGRAGQPSGHDVGHDGCPEERVGGDRAGAGRAGRHARRVRDRDRERRVKAGRNHAQNGETPFAGRVYF